jgi:hypothetical protein
MHRAIAVKLLNTPSALMSLTLSVINVSELLLSLQRTPFLFRVTGHALLPRRVDAWMTSLDQSSAMD